MNLAIKELADTKFEVLLCCCLSILNLFLLTSTNIFLCDNLPGTFLYKTKAFICISIYTLRVLVKRLPVAATLVAKITVECFSSLFTLLLFDGKMLGIVFSLRL